MFGRPLMITYSMPQNTSFTLCATHQLPAYSECALTGVLPGGDLVTIETYDDSDANPTRYIIHHPQQTEQSYVQRLGPDEDFSWPARPLVPEGVHRTSALNYVGGRWRGLREAERVSDWVQPLTIMEKMALLQQLKLQLPPLMLLGIAESRVLSEAHLHDNCYVVCRRLRLAYALTQPLQDADGLPYDYDTHAIYVAHVYDAARDLTPSLVEVLKGPGNIALAYPLDCLVDEDRLYVVEGGTPSTPCQLHIWQVNLTAACGMLTAP